MLDKKGISPQQCQMSTSGATSGQSSGAANAGPPSAGHTTPSSQSSLPDSGNALNNVTMTTNTTTNTSITGSNSESNAPNDKMMASLAAQDFVSIKTEDHISVNVATSLCESNTKTTTDNITNNCNNNNIMKDVKPTINTNMNLCGNRNIMSSDNFANNNMKGMSCAPNGVLNGAINGMNGMCVNTSSPLNMLNDDKLNFANNDFGMPVPTGNLPVPGELPPFPQMSQQMMRPRGPGPCGPGLASAPRMGVNAGMHSQQAHNNNIQLMMNNINTNTSKSSMTMDSQYMQQQSQIFVFNTKKANSAAEAVDAGMFSSIIDFHCSHPETKAILSKYPLKSPINRPNCPTAWLNNMSQMKPGGRGMKPNMSNTLPIMNPTMMKNNIGHPREAHPGPCPGSCNMHNPSGPGPGPGGGPNNNWSNISPMCSNVNTNWSTPQQQQQMFAQNSDMFSTSPMGPNGPNTRMCAPYASNNFQPTSQLSMGIPTQMSEISDENLTPQQRQNREKKLAILNTIKQQFCPEMVDSGPMGQMMRMPTPNQSMNAPDFMNDQNICPLPESDPLANTDTHMNNMTPSRMMATPNNNTQTPIPPNTGLASLEWQKSNFMDERRRKSQNNGQGVNINNNSVPISHQSPLSQPSSALNSPSPCISQSPGSRIPPPPYNQNIRSHPNSSPHPSSPATGSLPMPSPCMQSPADGSTQQFASAGQSRLSHTSPGPTTPSTDSNSGTGVHNWNKMNVSSAPNTIPSTTSTTVQNNCRTQANVTNIRANTPSNSASSPSPSTVKKLPNLKGVNQDCNDLLGNSGVEVNRAQSHHPNDVPLLGPPVGSNCSSPFICNKSEPALMPVPSPHQYLNTFEGQELTIQKQPNTSLRDADLMSNTAPDLDMGFGNEFPNNCQSFPSNERLPNFPMNPLEAMNQRFPLNHQNPNMSGNHFDMNARFMTPNDSNQRFVGPGAMFDGPIPRMLLNSHESQYRPQNMINMPYGQMDSNMMRFNTPCDNIMPTRVRGPSNLVTNRFNNPMNDMQPTQHYNTPPMSNMSQMPPMNNEQMIQFGANQSPGCMTPINTFNSQMESGFSSSPLQNLQKMTPPYDIGPPSKVDRMLSNGALGHNHNTNGSISSMSQNQRANNFDPISSMAAMGDSSGAPNPMMSGPSMNMPAISMAPNGQPPNMVNFHTSMSAMQGMQQNINAETMNGGIAAQFPNMNGGPQTVNNTYVNATMSIQQLNIQNMPNHGFNPNIDQNINSMNNMNMSSQSNLPVTSGGHINPNGASGAMHMMPNNNSKLGPNISSRMSGPTGGPNFVGQPMPNMRGMNPIMYQQNQQQMRFNSANIQIKPDAPNTIQYLPSRQQNPNMLPRGSITYLERYEPPLTNLGNKLPTHNLQYFPNNANPNVNFNRTQNMYN
ncbi:protein BCL9 homolog [Oppia nitens]|uniref:protein BCL9 homolog n=1 Tax=Oppia nitens TaxID=1686743 RepID=UPI0023DCE46F|nr:protein BCL9 homolog [Oppia nitens]